MPFKHKLGDKVTDQVTGFTGIVTIRAEYLHSPNRRYEVSPKCDLNGKAADPQWLDEGRLQAWVAPTPRKLRQG